MDQTENPDFRAILVSKEKLALLAPPALAAETQAQQAQQVLPGLPARPAQLVLEKRVSRVSRALQAQ